MSSSSRPCSDRGSRTPRPARPAGRALDPARVTVELRQAAGLDRCRALRTRVTRRPACGERTRHGESPDARSHAAGTDSVMAHPRAADEPGDRRGRRCVHRGRRRRPRARGRRLELFGGTRPRSRCRRSRRRRAVAPGKLIAVTAVTPTPAGEEDHDGDRAGRRADGAVIGRSSACASRPSALSLGIKGGGAGAGRAQLAPMEDREPPLHRRHPRGWIGEQPARRGPRRARPAWKRARDRPGDDHLALLDMNDRALRSVVTGLGGKASSLPRETASTSRPRRR